MNFEKIAPVWLKRNVPGESLPEQKLFDQRTLVGILAADETRLLHENPPRFPFLLSLENLKCKTFSEVSKHISFWECHLWDFYYLKVVHFSLLHCHLKAQLAISWQAKWDRRSAMSFSRWTLLWNLADHDWQLCRFRCLHWVLLRRVWPFLCIFRDVWIVCQ